MTMARSTEDSSVGKEIWLCRNYRRYVIMVMFVVFLLMVQLICSNFSKRFTQGNGPVSWDSRHKMSHPLLIPEDVDQHPSTLNASKIQTGKMPLTDMVFKPPNLNLASVIPRPNNIEKEEVKKDNSINSAELNRIMTNVTRMLSKSRGLNRTLIDHFKNQIAKLDTKRMFILSQETVKQQEPLHFAINRDRNQVISEDLFKSLPQKCPFADVRLKRCSVVGSSGILLKSGCGADIDNADYIFRCNAPSMTDELTVDAGSKTNMTTLNPSILWKRYDSLRSLKNKKSFLQAVQAQHADILLPLFNSKSGFSTARHITRFLKEAKNPRVKTLIIHPKHFVAVQDFWLRQGFQKRISSGLYLASAAIGLCDEVNLYGFWPFPVDTEERYVPYHYYDNERLTGDVHDFPVEFVALLQLHQDGIINLRWKPCQT